jgi:hypothetical protein
MQLKRGGAVAICWRGRMRIACAKRLEVETHCERNGEG